MLPSVFQHHPHRPFSHLRRICSRLLFRHGSTFSFVGASRKAGTVQIPISALLTSASVHDVNAAIPLMTMTAERVDYCYDVMDSAYDADAVLQHIQAAGRVPVVMPHPRRGTKKPSSLPKVFPPTPTPELCPAKQERFRERTSGERVNARLKDEFGGRHLRVRGPVKVMMHLMCGVIALTVDQWLRLAT